MYITHLRNKSKDYPRLHVNMRSEAFFICSHHVYKRYFLPSATFASGTKTRRGYFRPGYGEIVYYTSRE